MALGREEYKKIANNFLMGIGFYRNSDAFLEDMADRIFGFPNTEMVSSYAQIIFAKRGDIEFQTDEEVVGLHETIKGYISIVSGGEYSYTKIPYQIDKETGVVSAKLPAPLFYAEDAFNKLLSEIERDHRQNYKARGKNSITR